MNKFSKLFVGLATVALMASCSSDEPNPGNNENNENKPAGDVAFMAVKIKATEGRSTTDGGLVDGDADEHAVYDAQFFFFDEDGNHVMDAAIYNPAPDFSDPNKDNIEWNSDNVLVLDNLTAKGYPTYMLTVLNLPGFKALSTLEATGKALETYKDESEGGSGKFVMSTTSYFRNYFDDNHNDTYYYVTKLKTSNFYTSPEAAIADKQAVEVYVERLAAKVQVSVDATVAKELKLTIDGKEVKRNLYKLDASVAGSANEDGDVEYEKNEDGSFKLDESGEKIPVAGTSAYTDLYLYVVGWDLNATAKKSYLSKQLGDDWKDAAPYTNWNDPTRYRSYWGKSYLYNETPTADKLNYITVADLKDGNAEGGVDYCNENTNKHSKILEANSANQVLVNNQYVTHAVINTVICDINGNPINLINYKGLLYAEDSFKKKILTDINHDRGLNYYFITSTTEAEDGTKTNTYRQISMKDITFEQKDATKLGVCDMKLKIANDVIDKEKVFAKSTVDNKDTYTEIPNGITTLTKALSIENLIRHTDGSTVYYVPVEHNAPAGETATTENEGFYGVVRNHWYKINITSFTKPGHGVFDPEHGTETIIPDGPEDPLYYVGAHINIVNWKIVTQNTPL